MKVSTKSEPALIVEQAKLLEAFIVRDHENIVSDMGGEKVIFSVDNGKYYNLGVMGSQIWDLIQEPILVAKLIDLLIERYDVERFVCEEQLLPFLVNLSEEKLLHIKM